MGPMMRYILKSRSLVALSVGGYVTIVQPLLALQENDANIRALQQEARDIPIRKTQEKERLRGAKEMLATAQAALKAGQARVSAAEQDVAEQREKITKLRQQQLTLKTNKEFAAINLEIATIEGRIEDCEARQIVAMDALPPARDRVAECEKRLQDETTVVDGYIVELNARLAIVEAELKKAELARQEIVKTLPPGFITQYSRLLIRRWPPVVALEGNACGGCHLTQPPSISHSVRRNTNLVNCQSCGRILYAP